MKIMNNPSFFILLFMVILLPGCGSSGNNNSAPTASGAIIDDTNGGDVVVGDILIGSYSYADAEGDLEGASTFRWLRNGSVITGATAAGYILVPDDSGQSITFEVTPVAATGTTTGSAVTSSVISVVNNPPVALSQSVTTNEDSSSVIRLGSDVDGNSLTNTVTVAPTNGVLSGIGEYVTYTPNANFYGSDTFSFTLNDGVEDSLTEETITLTITADNDAPVATDGGITTSAGKTAVSDTLAATDTENDTLTYVLLTQPTKGTLTLDNAATGAFTYTPTTLGDDSFTFNVNDGVLDSNVGTITVTPPTLSVPATPTGELATAGDRRVSLSWDAVDYAETYNVYWSTVSGAGTSGTMVTVEKPYFYHDGVSNNTPYYYVVTAMNTEGESAASNEASAIPIDIAVSGLSFTDPNLATCVLATGVTYVHDINILNCSSRTISDLSGIEQLTSLNELYLSSNSIVNVSPLANLTQLSYLSIWGNPFNSGISPLRDLVNMDMLFLGGTGITDISPLANMSNMTTLHLPSNNISDIRPLAGMTALIDLSLGVNTISDITPLSALTNLTILDLYSNQISDISSLSAMTALTTLTLYNNNVFDVSALSTLSSLNSLSMYSNNIYDVTPLAGLGTNLNTLLLANNQITDVSPLASLVNLTGLSVRNNEIGGAGVGNVDTLITLTAATGADSINLLENPTMSCAELTTLVTALGSAVNPNVPDPGVNCTAP